MGAARLAEGGCENAVASVQVHKVVFGRAGTGSPPCLGLERDMDEAAGSVPGRSRRGGTALYVSLVLVLVLTYVPALAGRDVLLAWGHEDGPVESLGAAAFLVA